MIIVGKCHLHLGSNQGDRKVMIARAIQMIEVSIGPILGSSAMYETKAWGKIDQNDFINIALEVEHYLSPTGLLSQVNKIEDTIGRVRKEKWRSRKIDIDILFMEDVVVDSEKLTIPHKWMHKRNFVLDPMAELAPDFIHPVLDKTILELQCESTDETPTLRLESEYI